MGELTPIQEQRDVFDLIKDTKIAMSLAVVDFAGYAFWEEKIKYGVPVSDMPPMMCPRTAHVFADSISLQSEFARWMVDQHAMSKLVNKKL